MTDLPVAGGSSPEALRAGYEAVRQQVVDGRAGRAGGYGWGVLVRDGLAAWMHAWQALPPTAQPRPPSTGPAPRAIPWAVHTELTLVLTAMVLRE